MKTRLELIEAYICHHYGVTLDDIMGSSRFKKHYKPRQMIIYLCGTYTIATDRMMGNRYGRKRDSIRQNRLSISYQRLTDTRVDRFLTDAVSELNLNYK